MSSQFMKFEILGRLAFMDDVNEDIVNLKIAVNGKIKGEDICSWYRVSASSLQRLNLLGGVWWFGPQLP